MIYTNGKYNKKKPFSKETVQKPPIIAPFKLELLNNFLCCYGSVCVSYLFYYKINWLMDNFFPVIAFIVLVIYNLLFRLIIYLNQKGVDKRRLFLIVFSSFSFTLYLWLSFFPHSRFGSITENQKQELHGETDFIIRSFKGSCRLNKVKEKMNILGINNYTISLGLVASDNLSSEEIVYWSGVDLTLKQLERVKKEENSVRYFHYIKLLQDAFKASRKEFVVVFEDDFMNFGPLLLDLKKTIDNMPKTTDIVWLDSNNVFLWVLCRYLFAGTAGMIFRRESIPKIIDILIENILGKDMLTSDYILANACNRKDLNCYLIGLISQRPTRSQITLSVQPSMY